MPVNLELKVKTDGHQFYINRLNEINAEFVHVLTQKDIYYKCKCGLLKLRIEDDTQTLIKYKRDEKSGSDRWSDYQLLTILSPDAETFFEDTLDIETVVEKTRSLYLYNNTRIHLDEVKNAGTFLELETLVLGSPEEARKRFNKIKNLLELNDLDELKKSYRDILTGKGQ
ncbi:MAG: class IV adenylate cyclase [Bacteroidota bacterium]|nr:class IV adenylate cyclase [Bacteroidota bacterium]